MKKYFRIIKDNIAVSEVLSVIIVLSISVGVFITASFYILDDLEPEPEPSTIFHGTLKNGIFIVEHTRGSALNLKTICLLEIGGIEERFVAGDLLDNKSKSDGLWDIGERINFNIENYTYFKIFCKIIDIEENIILWDELIQDGYYSKYPCIIITIDPTNVKEGSAELNSVYNFVDKSGSVRFSYKEIGGNWINTTWVSKSGFGTYNKTIGGLSSNKIYIYKAQLTYDSNIISGDEEIILQNGVTYIDKISPYNITETKLNITATGSAFLNKINLWYRYSNDNSSWETNWWHSSWRNRKLITIDSTQVISDFYSFPVLIYEASDADLANFAQNDGDDIVFVLYADNNTKLNHEIQTFNKSTGKLIAWVNIPFLNSTVDTKIWMYYNNAVVENQENKAGVWNSNFLGVWHLDETPDDNIAGHYDSTIYNNHGTPLNFQDGGGGTTDAVGKIGGADYFAGDDDWVEIPHSSSLEISGNTVSLSAWIKMTSLQDDDEGIIVKSDGSDYNMQLGIQGDEKGNFRVKTTTGSTYLTGSTVLNVNQWYYLYGIYDGVTSSVFLNNFIDGNVNRNGDIISPLAPVVLGRRALGDDRFFKGIIDEARISSSARSPEWFETEYNNQNSPSTFYSVGSSEYLSEDWTCWDNINNPDVSIPWSWEFNFPNGEGYYQFYSVGYYNGNDEITPDSEDASCYFKT